MKAVLCALLTVTVLLAGCGGKGGGGGGDGVEPLKAGKGAISGLVINDVYRPVPDALVLASNGMTATTDASGQFTLIDLDPGAYLLRVQVDGHEAAPQSIDVVAGQYAESEIIARRIFNEGGRIITNEFSVFIPCAAGFIVNGITANCVLDLSGDSFRSSFTSNLTEHANVTYMVTEWKFSQAGDWNVQIREDNGEAAGGERYAVLDVMQGDYARVLLQKGVLNTEANDQSNNVVWNNTKLFATGIFLNGQFKNEAQDVYDQVPAVCETTQGQPGPDALCSATGVGATFGVRARIIQSVFIGEPDVDVTTYEVLA
jgi:hypothetical protein